MHRTASVLYMYQNGKKTNNELQIKFLAPMHLKSSLEQLANERHIALSFLLLLITSDYIKRNKQT